MKLHFVDPKRFSSAKRWNVNYLLAAGSDTPDAHGVESYQLKTLVNERREFLLPGDYPNVAFNYVGLENIAPSVRLLKDFAPRRGTQVKSRSKIFRRSDILYGRLRPSLNKCLVVDDTLREGICSTEIFVLIPNSDLVCNEFLAELLVSREVSARVSALVAGAALPRIQLSDFLEIRVPLPPMKTQRAAVSALMTAREELKSCLNQARFLQTAVSPAFSRHVFKGKPFTLTSSAYSELETWNNPLPQSALLHSARPRRLI